MPLRPVSMALTVAEKQAMGRPLGETPIEDTVDYPFGLTIHLDTAELRKLGFARGQLNPGDKVNVVATGMVTSASAEMVNSLESHRCSIQLQNLGVERVEDEEDRAQTLYGVNQS